MTPQQLKFYRWCATEAKKGMERIQRRKISAKEWEEIRHDIHRKACGHDVSSISLTNEQLDKVLAIFFSWSHPASLNLQLDQLDQPVRRCRFVADSLLDKINAVLEFKGREKQRVLPGPGRDAYLLHIARRVSGDDSLVLDSLTEDHWLEIIIRLHYRYNQVQRAGHGREAKRHRPLDRDNIERPQDRRTYIQPALTLDDQEDPF